MKLGGVDRATAYFGSMPGGAAEMANLGERHGAAVDRVAIAHSFRMLVVVSVIPVGITLAGFSATEDYRPVTVPFDIAGLCVLLAAGTALDALRLLERGATRGSELLTIARDVVRYAEEKPKPDSQRLREFTDAALPSLEQGMYSTAPIYPAMEEVVLENYFSFLAKELGESDATVKAMQEVCSGRVYVSPELWPYISGQRQLPSLTNMQKRVLGLLSSGMRSREIASKLCVSVRTVDSHRYAIMRTLGVTSSVALIREAERLGLIKH